MAVSLAVDAVLMIGEHGNYPKIEYGRTKYPRYEFFQQVTHVFRKDGRAVPVFNDKHLSWKWKWVKDPVAYRYKYGNGVKATMLMMNGLVEAGVRSLGTGQKRLETPHLAIQYEAPRESTFAHS